MNYRAEIDGLRALAVVPVIFFHAGFDLFRGGFVGVDVFFVISGFLITSILLSDLQHDRFSLIRFYERRARRIMPALLVVLLGSFLLAWNLLLPVDMKAFSHDLLGVVLFVSNFLFWTGTDYWDADSDLNPLLHTWSLAVEEQFYLLFPLLLMLIWKRGRGFLSVVLIVIGVGSLLWSQWSTSHAPMAGYFLLPGRAWELLLGALVALLTQRNASTSSSLLEGWIPRLCKEVCGTVGIALIVFSILALDSSSPFPGFLALLPTLGTALVLAFATSETLAGRVLALRPLVAVGLISYSAYLWHQPLLAFLRQASLGAPESGLVAAVVGATFLLAALTWYFVELPFRRGVVLSGAPLFKAALACSLAFVALGIAGQKSYGFINRFAGAEVYLSWAQKTRINFGLHASCDGQNLQSAQCRTSDSPEILVWGDSYAMHLVPGILAANPAAGIVQMTKSSCAPFLSLTALKKNYTPQPCLDFSDEVASRVATMPSLKYAVLSSPFTGYFADNSRVMRAEGDIAEATMQSTDAEFRKTLGYLVEQGVTPVIFSPTPGNNGADIGRCLGRAEYFGNDLASCNFRSEKAGSDQQRVFAWLRRLSEDYQVVFLDDWLCPAGVCQAHFGNSFYYRDAGHLSVAGSVMLGKLADFYGLITGDAGAGPLPIRGIGGHRDHSGNIPMP